MKKYILILITFLVVNCSNKKEFHGFWYGKFEYNGQKFPVLLKFEKDYYIDYFSIPFDTLEYKITGQNITASGIHLNQEYKYEYRHNEDSLSFFYPESGYKINLYRPSESNFVFDFLKDKELLIELPKGNREEKVLGEGYSFHRPLYLTYKNEKLVANFFDTTVVVDNEYYKFILSHKEYEFDAHWSVIPVTIIADKNVKSSDLSLLKEQLGLTELRRINYILDSKHYDKVKTFASYIPPTEKEYEKAKSLGLKIPPPPPILTDLETEFFINHAIVFEINGQSILYNDSVIQEIELKKLIQKNSELYSNSHFKILFYLNENTVLQDYIDFIVPVYNSIFELRDQYLSEKYNDLNNYSEKIINEAKERYPLALRELNQEEFTKTKYNL